MKLFGTHVYPKNKYLTLQLTRSSKGVVCEDCFESMVSIWWYLLSFALIVVLRDGNGKGSGQGVSFLTSRLLFQPQNLN